MTLRKLALALPLVAACGGEVSSPSEPPDETVRSDAGAFDSSRPTDASRSETGPLDAGVFRQAPRDLSASTSLPDRIELRWNPPVAAGVTGYRVLRGSQVLAKVGGQTTSFDDLSVAPTLVAPNFGVSQGTFVEGIAFSWNFSYVPEPPVDHVYSVVAEYGAEASAPSPSATGVATRKMTGVDFSRDDGASWEALPDSAVAAMSYLDERAPKSTLMLPNPTATPDDRRSLVVLALPSHPSVVRAPSSLYRLRGRSGSFAGPPSEARPGYRGAGLVDRLSIQWQRSAGPTDGAYSDLPNVTGRKWFDDTGPTDAVRYYRARVEAPIWADVAAPSRAVSASARGWARVVGWRGGGCGIRRSDSRIVCWGYGDSTFPTSPTPDAFAELTSNGLALCGIRASDRKVLCWGQNAWGETPPGPSTNSYRAVAIGAQVSCGIRSLDDKVECWGAGPNDGNLASSVSSHTYRDIKIAGASSCGVALDDGHIYCWGPPQNGVETLVDSGRFESLVLFLDYYCGIQQGSRTVRCSAPLGVPSGVALSSLTYDIGGACGVRATDSRLVCWNRQMVDVTPPGVEDPVTSLGATAHGGCVVMAGGRLRCWGNNAFGDSESLPPRGPVKQIALEEEHGCAVNADDSLSCWGWNQFGEATRSTGALAEVAVGPLSTCGIRKSDQGVSCWGGGTDPILPPPPGPFSKLTVGRGAYCGIGANDGLVRCWGANWSPFRNSVSTMPFDAISGTSPMCGVARGSGYVTCYGTNPSSVIGDAPSVGTGGMCARVGGLKPACWRFGEPVPNLPNIEVDSVATGSDFACALAREDAHVTCWPLTAGASVPSPSMDAFSAIAASPAGICGIRLPDSKVICWGKASSGLPRLLP
jgi:hypothetical protein